jgi:DNA invertase Pin-like site-specific DNA recombinase
MSEAELHIMRCRLQGNLESKARRGELKLPLPTGLEYNAAGHVVLDPDQQVQQSFRNFFKTFERTGTACATVKYFRQHRLMIPRRLRRGERKGELTWVELDHARALKILHNLRYGGAYVRGRTQTSNVSRIDPH